jgi:protein-S-isoprenylcysteine O-methyltransferase Ste14
LLEARRKTLRKDTKAFDKLFYALFLPLVLALPLVAGFDAGRGHSMLSFVAVYPGVVLLLLGAALTTAALMVNAHAEASVRIGEEQRVITTGPYRYLRHPMYTGTLLGFPAAALITGSAWAFVPAGLMSLLFVWRTAREDAALHQELQGYAEYASETPYRLVPGIW